MTGNEIDIRIQSILKVCETHRERLQHAVTSLSDIFPLNDPDVEKLTPDQISHTDQMIYRFSHLQDTLGGKLFPALLESLGETPSGMPFIDVLNHLEKLGIIDSKDTWLGMRENRNLATQEYPDQTAERTRGLNEIFNQSATLSRALENVKGYLAKRSESV